MKVAYAEIPPEQRPHILSLGPGILDNLEPQDQTSVWQAIRRASDSGEEQGDLGTRYMPPGVYRLEDRLPRPLEVVRREIFQKIELRVVQLDETTTTGAVIADFTPAVRRAYKIEQNVANVAERIPGLRRKIQELHGEEVGEITESGVRIPVTESSIIYVTHTRLARNAAEFVREGAIINEVQGVIYLAE